MRLSRDKIKTPAELAEIVRALKADGKTVVHCHGVFDLVHLGHANYFEQAKRLGDVVYVGVIADRFVRKGPGRPYFTEAERLAWVAALESVDYVVLNEEEGPWSLMRAVRPDVYTKDESDRKKLDDPASKLHDDIRVIEEVGGRFVFIPVEVDLHSTDIFRKFNFE
jgi:rfaE bifunctional protein nucleotidyltransferase chain/domain